ncbi:MAG: tetratricopeptide repeat protein [Planctomycetes bacterium]|nr:tetratricopeptide repeat protein [Planctomycetota bacterium]
MKLLALALLLFGQGAELDRARAVAALREDLELDSPREALVRSSPWTAKDGAFEHDGEVLALTARALAATGEDARARKLLEQATPTDATKSWIELERARLALENDDLEAAARALAGEKGAAVRYPDIAECWLLRGRALARQQKFADAAPLFRRFLELAPFSVDAPAACHQLAQAALARADDAEAQKWFTRAAELGTWQGFYRARRIQIREHPDDPLPRVGLAQLFLEAHDYARAEALLTELTATTPTFASGWFLLGEARRKQRDLDGASKAYTQALDLDPELPFARFNRAVIARMQGRDVDARADLERIVGGPAADDERLLKAHLELARLLVRAGDAEAANTRYRRYTELGGKDPLAEPTR